MLQKIKIRNFAIGILLLTGLVTAQTYTVISEGKNVTVSSTESASGDLNAENAVDGDEGTRWSSDFYDNQWIRIDLGEELPVDKIVIKWEDAYASEYKIYFSNTAGDWGSVKIHETDGEGGTEEYVNEYGSARYITLYGITRGTSYGISTWEFELYSKKEVIISKKKYIDTQDLITKVDIGNQTWMARNLLRPIESLSCYENSISACETFGSLYTWDEAMAACPDGWHLPSKEEWKSLVDYIDSQNGEMNVVSNLKSSFGWGTAGTDDFGFAALPGGHYKNGEFSSVGLNALLWTSTESSSTKATYVDIFDRASGIYFGKWGNKATKRSVRCIDSSI